MREWTPDVQASLSYYFNTRHLCVCVCVFSRCVCAFAFQRKRLPTAGTNQPQASASQFASMQRESFLSSDSFNPSSTRRRLTLSIRHRQTLGFIEIFWKAPGLQTQQPGRSDVSLGRSALSGFYFRRRRRCREILTTSNI